MSPGTHEATSVVVATDGSTFADAAIDWAATEAVSRQEPLVIITARPPDEPPEDEAPRKMLQTAAERVRSGHPDLVVTTEIFSGDPRRALELYESVATLMVVGSRGLGSVRSVLLGSVSFWATRHLTVPFVVVRPPDTERLSTPRAIAVGLGSAPDSDATLRHAFAMAHRRGCSLTIGNAAWDEHAIGNTWSMLSADEVEPRRRAAVTELSERIARQFPDVRYSILFARGRVDYFLASLGHRHEALVLGRGQSTFLDFVSLGTLATFVVEHGVGATMVIPT
ncbi:MAG: universal stress protein [Marmoricola sp.]